MPVEVWISPVHAGEASRISDVIKHHEVVIRRGRRTRSRPAPGFCFILAVVVERAAIARRVSGTTDFPAEADQVCMKRIPLAPGEYHPHHFEGLFGRSGSWCEAKPCTKAVNMGVNWKNVPSQREQEHTRRRLDPNAIQTH